MTVIRHWTTGTLIGVRGEYVLQGGERIHAAKAIAEMGGEIERLTGQLRGAVGALRDLVRLVESIDYEDDLGDAEAVADAKAIIRLGGR